MRRITSDLMFDISSNKRCSALQLAHVRHRHVWQTGLDVDLRRRYAVVPEQVLDALQRYSRTVHVGRALALDVVQAEVGAAPFFT